MVSFFDIFTGKKRNNYIFGLSIIINEKPDDVGAV